MNIVCIYHWEFCYNSRVQSHLDLQNIFEGCLEMCVDLVMIFSIFASFFTLKVWNLNPIQPYICNTYILVLLVDCLSVQLSTASWDDWHII